MNLLPIISIILLASSATAFSTMNLKRENTGVTAVSKEKALNAVYWGNSTYPFLKSDNLENYCTKNSGIDIILLSFLSTWATNGIIPYGSLSPDCHIDKKGQATGCDGLASAISTCQKAGVKVLLSIGGGGNEYSLNSKKQAIAIGKYLWEAYGMAGNSTSGTERPFGHSVVVDGWDFDIENNQGSIHYAALIETLRGNFKKDASRKYYITGAPQCPIPEPNMYTIFNNTKFDYLWIQFYNNPGCSANSGLNYAAWVKNITGTASYGAKLSLGVTAAGLAATNSTSGEKYYLPPSDLATIVKQYRDDTNFGGVMMWNAAWSDNNIVDDCTYAQQAHRILNAGIPCSPSSSPPKSSSSTSNTANPGKAPGKTTSETTTSIVPPGTAKVKPSAGSDAGNGKISPSTSTSSATTSKIST